VVVDLFVANDAPNGPAMVDMCLRRRAFIQVGVSIRGPSIALVPLRTPQIGYSILL
jgi:hypothetical protein